MALVEKALVLLMMIMVAAQVSNAAVYKVGDSAGWTTLGDINYKKWAADKKFEIGDTIVFEYDAQFHNVMRVKNHTVYKSCDASSPLETYTTGNDAIKITKYGHHYFLCSVPGHCLTGQKVDINVSKKVPASAPAPTISPSALATPAPVSNTPSPLNVGKGAFGFVGLAMTVFSIFYF